MGYIGWRFDPEVVPNSKSNDFEDSVSFGVHLGVHWGALGGSLEGQFGSCEVHLGSLGGHLGVAWGAPWVT